MIKIFKNSSFSQVIVIFVTVVILWLRAFINPIATAPSQTFAPLYNIIQGWLADLPILASAIALLIVLVEGIWLNLMLFNHKLISNNTLMPLFLYIIIMSWDTATLTITPMLFVNLLMIASCALLFSDSAKPLSSDRIFYASAYIGLAALLYLPALLLVVAFMSIYIVYKLYNWRFLIIGILGLIAPAIAYFTYVFMVDRLDYTLFLISYDIGDIRSGWTMGDTLPVVTGMILVAFTAFLLLNELLNMKEKMIHQRINVWIILYPIIAAAILAYYTKTIPFDIQPMAPSFAYMATVFFLTDRRQKWIGETTLLCFLALLIIDYAQFIL